MARYKARTAEFSRDGQDNIVYTRKATKNPFWERIRENALNTVPSSSTLNFKDGWLETFISAAAQAEEDKENAFLDKFYTKKNGGGNESNIDKFNILF